MADIRSLVQSLLSLIKNEKHRDLAVKSWQVSWPMILIMLFQFFTGITDTYIAGILGPEYQAAMGLANQIYFVLIILANAMTVGSVAVVSRLNGSDDQVAVNRAITTIVLFSLGGGIVLSLAGSLAAPWIVGLIDAPEIVSSTGIPLLQIYAGGLVANYVFITIQGILRSVGLVKKSLITMALAVSLNVILTVAMVFYTPLGYRGLAVSTVTSIVIGTLPGLFFLRRHFTRRLAGGLKIVRRIVRIGWPAGLMQVSWQGGILVLYAIIGKIPLDAVPIMAAFTNGVRIESVIFLPAFAFNMANAVITGNFLGKKDLRNAFNSGIITAIIGVTFTVIASIIVIANADSLARLLTRDELVAAHTARYLTIAILAEPLMALAAILGGSLNGAGDTRGFMKSGIISVWLVRIPLALTCISFAGFSITVLWWIMNLSLAIHALIVTRRYLRRQWMDLPHE